MINLFKLNKMKKTYFYPLFVLLLIASGLKSQAQEFLPIIQEGNEWHTLEVIPYSTTYNTLVNWLDGDTVVEDVHYTKVMQNVNGSGCTLAAMLREEDGKVWGRLYNFQEEKLIYDFTANVGDTLRCGYWHSNNPYIDEYITLDSISIENIGGIDRKKFWLGMEYDWTGEPYAIETWIEGMGSDFGILYSGAYGITGGVYHALCFHQNGELVWQNPEYDECIITSVDEIDGDELSIYPNPATNKAVIEGVEAAEVQIYNALGQLVNTVYGTNEISVTGLPEGVYMLHVIAINKEVYNTRFVIRQ